MQENIERLIRIPVQDSKANYLSGFWQWVQLLAKDDYQGALEALYWPKESSWTRDELRKRVTTFYGGHKPWTVVVPNERLVSVVNDAAEFQLRTQNCRGWFMAQIPLTTEPEEPKRDDILLMGLATSFVLTELQTHYVMELEIFHV